MSGKKELPIAGLRITKLIDDVKELVARETVVPILVVIAEECNECLGLG
jgi:hypothetical protein